MKTNIIGLIVLVLVIIGSCFFVLITHFERDTNINKVIPPGDNTSPGLGNITSFDDSVKAFTFNFYRTFYNDSKLR